MTLRRAVALPAVLFAMALTSALVVGGVYAARTLGTRGRIVRSATELYWPAERVLTELVAIWDTTGRAAMPVGAVIAEPVISVEGVVVSAWVTRLSEESYWMVAEAVSSTPDRIRSRVALLVRSAEGRIRPAPGAAWTRLP